MTRTSGYDASSIKLNHTPEFEPRMFQDIFMIYIVSIAQTGVLMTENVVIKHKLS